MHAELLILAIVAAVFIVQQWWVEKRRVGASERGVALTFKLPLPLASIKDSVVLYLVNFESILIVVSLPDVSENEGAELETRRDDVAENENHGVIHILVEFLDEQLV